MGATGYITFLGVCLLVICTPGPDTALTIRNTLRGGRRAGVATAAGVAVGQATWTVATSAGLAVVLVASAPLALGIRLAGAAYLFYLGAKSLWRAIKGGDPWLAAERPTNRLRPRTAFSQGLISNLGNPKMVAFFVGLLPPFAGSHPGLGQLLLLGLNFCALTLLWLVLYSIAVDRVSGWFRRSSIRRAIDGLLGATLLGAGLKVGVEAVR